MQGNHWAKPALYINTNTHAEMHDRYINNNSRIAADLYSMRCPFFQSCTYSQYMYYRPK